MTPSQESSTAPAPQLRPQTSQQRQRYLQWVNDQLEEELGVRKCQVQGEDQCLQRIPQEGRASLVSEVPGDRKSATIGQRIRTFRITAMISQKALSDRTGIGVEVLWEYEFDRQKPSEVHLRKLVEALGRELVSGLIEHVQRVQQPPVTS